MVSASLGQDCCGTDECSGVCGQGGTVEQIKRELDKVASFTYVDAPLSEVQLQQHLRAKQPVLRLTTAHIDVVSGCSGGTYSVTDSEYAEPFTTHFASLLQSPYNPAAKWVGTFVPSTSVRGVVEEM